MSARLTPSPPGTEEPASQGRPVVVLTTTHDTVEIEGLVRALGFRLFSIVRQPRPRPDPATFLGKGKLEDVRRALKDLPHPPISDAAALAVVDAALKPPTLFNLEDELKVEVWDRVRLILEIFQKHARIKEARLQVELARLRYELPFVHEALHRRLTGEHPGFMGGGEVEARTYETHLKRRTRIVKHELERVRKERGTRRAGRRRAGWRLVSIAGYTNSGKSSLLNALTESEVIVRDQLFSTLQTTTRRLRSEFHPHQPNDLLLTDTVGFIRNLPPWMIDAFSSTLEEITESDAILFVVDVNEPVEEVEEKSRTALAVLKRIHAPSRMCILLHKADQVPQDQRSPLLRRLQLSVFPPDVPLLFTSMLTGEGLSELVQLLQVSILESKVAWIELDPVQAAHVRLEHWLRERTEILEQEIVAGRQRFRIRCPVDQWGPLLSQALKAGARVHPTDSSGRKGGPPSG